MTRATGAASASDRRGTGTALGGSGGSSCSRARSSRDCVAYESLQPLAELRKLTAAPGGAGRRGDAAAVTSSLLGPSAGLVAGTVENRHARRERVTRSWTGGYGTLLDSASSAPGGARVEAGAGPAHGGGGGAGAGAIRKASPGNVPQQQFLRSLQRASSTILTKASSAVTGNNNNNSCSLNHNIGSNSAYAASHGCLVDGAAAAACERVETADAARRSRIDVLLMPSLKSLVSRRPAPGPSSRGGAGGAGAGASSSSGACDMGGSSSSGVAASASHHLKSKSAAAMVPLMRREASCASLRVGGSADPLGLASEEVFSGGASGSDSSSSSSPRADAGHAAGAVGRSMRKCETVLALSNLGAMLRSASSSRTTIHVEPLKAVNRLRVPPQSPFGGSTSRMCSRCSSLLSMASSSRYSLNTAGGFVPRAATPPAEPQALLCKLCLAEVPLAATCQILQCGCCFCKDCMKTYIEFEIQEGAYDISCPDAQCDKQGVISMSEIENLVSVEMVEKHRKFRLNREVDLDVNRTWCPRAGCETVCSVCPMERCQPQSVHCRTCTSDFCSNCKNPWHPGLTCEENSQRLAKEGMPDNMEPGIPFDSDLIKCCPMCNVPIEKDEGCAQMMCKRCKHVFCWYCLASLDDDFLLRHYDKGPCKNKLGHSRASVIWHRTQVIGIFAGFGILLLVASPLLLLAAPCIVCCKCRICSGGSKLDSEDEMPEESAS